MWIFLCVLSAFLFALNHIVSKEFSQRETTTEFLPLLYLFAFVILLPFASYLQPLGVGLFSKILLFTIFGTLGTFCLFYAYSKTDISSTSPLLNLSPVILFITSFFLLGEKASITDYAGVLLIVVGGYLISLKHLKDIFHPFTSIPLRYFFLVLLTLVLWSFSAPIAKMTLQSINVYSFIFYSMLFGAVLWFAIEGVLKRRDFFIGVKNHWKLAVYGAFFYLGAELTFFLALSIPEVFVSLAIPIRRTSSLFIVLAGGHFFHENKIRQKALACLVMLAGVFVIALF